MRSSSGLALLFGLACSVAAAEDPVPDLDFLEYLGSWQDGDEEWVLIADWEADESAAPAGEGNTTTATPARSPEASTATPVRAPEVGTAMPVGASEGSTTTATPARAPETEPANAAQNSGAAEQLE